MEKAIDILDVKYTTTLGHIKTHKQTHTHTPVNMSNTQRERKNKSKQE